MAIDHKAAPPVVGQPDRKSNPVFVVGCPRSGTTLLYDMLLSAGDFAILMSETHVFDLAPRFGDLRDVRNRRRLLDFWVHSAVFARAELDRDSFRDQILEECRNSGDFLRIFMESVAKRQNVRRWADNTPAHLLHLTEIKRTIPDALFLHIIRDGRDVATSLTKLGWIRPFPRDRGGNGVVFPWDRRRTAVAAGLYWAWMVHTGRREARQVAPAYLEVRYEDLLGHPQETLNRIGEFIGHTLDSAQIQRVGLRAVGTPTTAFPGSQQGFIGRWKQQIPPQQARLLEHMAGPLLEELGYERVWPEAKTGINLRAEAMRRLYYSYFEAKRRLYWLKKYTPLGRVLGRPSALGPDATPPQVKSS